MLSDRRREAIARPKGLDGTVWCVGAEDLELRIPFLKALCVAGFRVEAVGSGAAHPFAGAGIPFHAYPMNRALAPAEDVRSVVSLVRLIRQHRPSIVHGFDTKPSLLAPLAVAVAGCGHAVRTINGLGRIFASGGRPAPGLRLAYCSLQRLAAPLTATTVFQNAHDRAFFESRHLVRREAVALIPGSGVDVDALTHVARDRQAIDNLRRELGLDNALIVTCAARLTRQKGIPELLQASARLARSRRDVVVLLVGPSQNEGFQAVPLSEIRRHEPRVRVLGSRRDVPLILAASDVFVLPTLYAEGVPRALLEAGAVGLPLIATTMPGCTDVVRDGWNGILVPPGNADALAVAIERLAEAPALRRQMGARSRRKVQDAFSLQHVTDAYARIYSDLLAK